MKALYQIFYTHKRTEILLAAKGIKAKVMKVAIVRPSGKFYNCVHVVYRTVNGICSMFISCKEYLQRAIANRQQSASEYVVTQRSNPAHWDVTNGRDLTASGYLVVTTPDLVTCSCKDFEEQAGYLQHHPYLWQQIMKAKRTCKHIYSVLNTLGCSTLGDYFKQWRSGGRFYEIAAA